jgi:hypothetical protein
LERLFRILNSHSAVKFSQDNFKDKFGNRDWRKYIPKIIQKEWFKMTTREKHLSFIFAESQARNEHYREPIVINKKNFLTQEQKERIDLLRLRNIERT